MQERRYVSIKQNTFALQTAKRSKLCLNVYENKAVLSVKMNIVGTVIDQCNNKITEEFTLCFTVCRVKIFIMIDVQDHFTSFRTYMK